MLDDFLSGELTVESNREILAHLEECRACSQEERSRSQMRRALRESWNAQPLPAGFGERIRTVTSDHRLSLPSLMRLAASLAVAGVALTLFALTGLDSTLLAVDHYAEVAGDHIECSGVVQPDGVRLPLDGAQAEVEKTLSQAAGESCRLVERRRCQSGEAALIHYVFEGSDRYFSLVLEERSPFERLSPHGHQGQVEVNGIKVFAFKQGAATLAGFEKAGHFAYLVGPELETHQVLEMARALVPVITGFSM